MTTSPASKEIRDLRQSAGLTQSQAAAIVHASLRSWQEWEAGDSAMHPGLWELFSERVSRPADIAMDPQNVDNFIADWKVMKPGRMALLAALDSEPIDYTLKAGDMVYSPHWWGGNRAFEVVDINWALGAGAFRLSAGGGVVVWPVAGKRRTPFAEQELAHVSNPHPAGTLAHDVWNRGYAGKPFTGHEGSVAELWHQAGAAARQQSKRQKGGAK